MILMHKSLKRSEDIMRSLCRYCEVNFKSIDGVIETFNNDIGQGYILKIYQSFNTSNDLAIWFFESLKDKNIQVAYSIQKNIDGLNNWIDKEKVNFKIYPIKSEIKKTIIEDIHDIVGDYYGLNLSLNNQKDINI